MAAKSETPGEAVPGPPPTATAATRAETSTVGSIVRTAALPSRFDSAASPRSDAGFSPAPRASALIAAELFLSPHTIKSQAVSLYRKLGASSQSQGVARAREPGMPEG